MSVVADMAPEFVPVALAEAERLAARCGPSDSITRRSLEGLCEELRARLAEDKATEAEDG